MDTQKTKINGISEGALKTLQKEFLVIGTTHIRAWHAWLLIGLMAGVTAGILFVANRSFGTETISAAPSVGFHRGVYALAPANGKVNSKVFTNPAAAGVALRVSWNFIETREGRYDWEYLDTQIALAKKNNKKVSIYLKAGQVENVPKWLTRKYNVKVFTYDDTNEMHDCSTEKPCKVAFVAPWDPAYLEKLLKFVRVLGDRYQNEPTITYVRGGSQNILSGWEKSKKLYSKNGNSELSWEGEGFSEERIVAAAKQLINGYMEAFPRAAFWDEPVVLKAWKAIPGTTSQLSLSENIIQYGFLAHPDRYGVWREDLHACTPLNPPGDTGYTQLFKILWENPGRNGAQMLWNVQDCRTNAQSCRMNKGCVQDEDQDGDLDMADVIRRAVDNAAAYQMPYLEIYQIDVVDPALQEVMKYAADKLL